MEKFFSFLLILSEFLNQDILKFWRRSYCVIAFLFLIIFSKKMCLVWQVCAVGSRNGTEETKLLVLDFDAEVKQPPPFCVHTTRTKNRFTECVCSVYTSLVSTVAAVMRYRTIYICHYKTVGQARAGVSFTCPDLYILLTRYL